MAIINMNTIDRAKRQLYYRLNKQQVPVKLPYETCVIDADDSFFEPEPFVTLGANGTPARGEIAGAVYLQRNAALPLAAQQARQAGDRPGDFAVWSYYGI